MKEPIKYNINSLKSDLNTQNKTISGNNKKDIIPSKNFKLDLKNNDSNKSIGNSSIKSNDLFNSNNQNIKNNVVMINNTNDSKENKLLNMETNSNTNNKNHNNLNKQESVSQFYN